MRVAEASAAAEAGFRSGAGADLSTLQVATAETLTVLATFGLEA